MEMHEGFHYQDGLYFERMDGGNVRVQKWANGDPNDLLLFEFTVDPDGWASIISSVSAQGEEHGRFYEAQKFHMGEG